MTPIEELDAIASAAANAANQQSTDEISIPLTRLTETAKKVGAAFSGSWLGYHSRIYHAGLTPPPPGSHFSQEWGLESLSFVNGTTGSWVEFDAEKIKSTIFGLAGEPNLEAARAASSTARETFERLKPEALSILEQSFLASRTPSLPWSRTSWRTRGRFPQTR